MRVAGGEGSGRILGVFNGGRVVEEPVAEKLVWICKWGTGGRGREECKSDDVLDVSASDSCSICATSQRAADGLPRRTILTPAPHPLSRRRCISSGVISAYRSAALHGRLGQTLLDRQEEHTASLSIASIVRTYERRTRFRTMEPDGGEHHPPRVRTMLRCEIVVSG